MADPATATYITYMAITAAINAGVQIFNGLRQNKLSKVNNAAALKTQKENIIRQLKVQKNIQLTAYNLASGWPLDTTPEGIADTIQNCKGEIPLYLVIAPCAVNDFKPILSNVKNFFSSNFKLNSKSPVFFGHYKANAVTDAQTDYQKIWSKLNMLPTLYVAFHSTDYGDVAGFTVAFWDGSKDCRPVTQTFELNMQKLFTDTLRKEMKTFEGDKTNLPEKIIENIRFFEQEKSLLNKGYTIEELEHRGFYSNLKPTKNVYKSVVNQISSMINIVLAYLADFYFVLEYGADPRFPQLISKIKKTAAFPDLLTREELQVGNNHKILTGNKFLENVYRDYSYLVAQNIDPLTGVSLIPVFREAYPEIENMFEKTLIARCIPERTDPAMYSAEQFRFLEAIEKVSSSKCPTGVLKKLRISSAGKILSNANGIPADADQISENIVLTLPNGEILELVKIKAGHFNMGSPDDEIGRFNDEKLHSVTLSRDYWIGKYPVTKKQYNALFNLVTASVIENEPVTKIAYSDAIEYCRKLNEICKAQLPGGYRVDLPSEAQWEYACRAGTDSAFYNGAQLDNPADIFQEKSVALSKIAWYGGTGPNTVGKKMANAWGLYDMLGNVLEMCRDTYLAYKPEAVDPERFIKGFPMVCRGGKFDFLPLQCRSATRFTLRDDEVADNDIGFRIVITSGSDYPESNDNIYMQTQYFLNIRSYLRSSYYTCCTGIPEYKSSNAIASYARELNMDDIFLLYDDSFFGGSKTGFCISKEGVLYTSTSGGMKIKYSDNLKFQQTSIYPLVMYGDKITGNICGQLNEEELENILIIMKMLSELSMCS